jgi:hypothetical protein
VQKEIIGDCQCEFRQNGSITDLIFWICQVLEKNKRNTMRQCMEFKEAHDLFGWEVLYNILIEFGIIDYIRGT